MKKVGKTNRPFRYDLNQIPNDYTVEVRNRFKGLDLIDRVPDGPPKVQASTRPEARLLLVLCNWRVRMREAVS